MVMASGYCGAWTALVTPFTREYNVDWESLEMNVGFQVEQGITGVLPMGTTGESATVTHEEHSQIISKTVEYVGGKRHVLAGTGSNSTDEAVYETALAVDAGVNACLLVDCYYNKPSSHELRLEYYAPVLEKFPDTDFISYAIPGRSVTVISPEDLAILRSQHKNLVAVKEATGDFERMRRTRQITDSEFRILSGDDPNTHKMMSDKLINSTGVISVLSNIVPKAVSDQVSAALSQDFEKSAEIDAILSPLSNVLGVTTEEEVLLPDGSSAVVANKCPNPVPIKAMMEVLGMHSGKCKRPLGKLTKKGAKMVRDALSHVYSISPEILEPIEGYYDVDIGSQIKDEEVWNKISY
jgi:4-hydroxy-tetrahydrodipicolinate synthase